MLKLLHRAWLEFIWANVLLGWGAIMSKCFANGVMTGQVSSAPMFFMLAIVFYLLLSLAFVRLFAIDGDFRLDEMIEKEFEFK